MAAADPLARLTDAGVAVWLDDLSRDRLTSGNLERLVRDRHVVGVTSNPTIFAKALSGSDDYAEQLARLAARRVGVDEAVREIITDDVRSAVGLPGAVVPRQGGGRAQVVPLNANEYT